MRSLRGFAIKFRNCSSGSLSIDHPTLHVYDPVVMIFGAKYVLSYKKWLTIVYYNRNGVISVSWSVLMNYVGYRFGIYKLQYLHNVLYRKISKLLSYK